VVLRKDAPRVNPHGTIRRVMPLISSRINVLSQRESDSSSVPKIPRYSVERRPMVIILGSIMFVYCQSQSNYPVHLLWSSSLVSS
jgi:hypothetical protein